MAASDRVIDAYLHELANALRWLPAAEREEFLGEISSHIEALRHDMGASRDDVAAIRKVLERVGEPVAIARAAAIATPRERSRFGPIELGSISLLALSSVLVGVGFFGFLDPGWIGTSLWCGGLLLAWFAPGWRLPDKVVGSLLAPFVFLLSVGLYEGAGWIGVWLVYGVALGMWFAALHFVWRQSTWPTRDKRIAAVLPALLGLTVVFGAWGLEMPQQGHGVAISEISWIALPLFAAAYLSVRCQLPSHSKHWHPDLVSVGG